MFILDHSVDAAVGVIRHTSLAPPHPAQNTVRRPLPRSKPFY